MVRATAANMLMLFGGTYPPGHDATTFGNIAIHADALIDAFCLPAALSTTDTTALGIANRVAAHIVDHAVWLAAGGHMSGQAHPEILSHDMKELISKCLMDTTSDGWHAIGWIDEGV